MLQGHAETYEARDEAHGSWFAISEAIAAAGVVAYRIELVQGGRAGQLMSHTAIELLSQSQPIFSHQVSRFLMEAEQTVEVLTSTKPVFGSGK